jgi:molybdopterin/thiamine biosynthesis adenylyltransferase/proteasome lid subunit RPN8/RPN11
MRYTLTFVQEDHDRLVGHLFAVPEVERAAYLLCRTSVTGSEIRLLVREVIPVSEDDVLESSVSHMRIASKSYIRALKRADEHKSCFVFVHSHPGGLRDHSEQDDQEEAKLFRTAFTRIHSPGPHASLIFAQGSVSSARVWLEDGSRQSIDLVRIVGNKFRYYFADAAQEEIPEFFDRQVRAFGSDIQRLLGKIHVGIVGAGGTGSAVAEQLIRLGVGALTVSDGDTFEQSNVNRVYGSRVADRGLPKVELVERQAAKIGLGTSIHAISRPVTFQSALAQFRNCDLVFGCTDDEMGRSLLNRLAVYYYIPVFDMGIKIDSENGVVRSIQGRVTILMPGNACLNCRGRISAQRISAESKRAVNPEDANELAAEGYIPELNAPAPAVIAFTSTIASAAVIEFLHKLTGILGPERETSEVLHLIDETRIRRNHMQPEENCFCGDKLYWGRGDTRPFLDSTWRPE